VLLVGFLKFLKREKKKEDLYELDLPPEPPMLSDFEKNAPSSGVLDNPPEPDFNFSEAGEKSTNQEESTEFPAFPEIEEDPLSIPTISAPAEIQNNVPDEHEFGQLNIAEEEEPPKELEEHEESEEEHKPEDSHLQAEEKPVKFQMQRKVPIGKIIYIRVDEFKMMAASINAIRNDLKISEEDLAKLESDKHAKDKSFDKVKSCLDDLQKKLIFIDKTLFKGE